MSLGHPAGVPAKMPFPFRFSIVNNRKSLGHRPVSRGFCLSLCALFFPDWKDAENIISCYVQLVQPQAPYRNRPWGIKLMRGDCVRRCGMKRRWKYHSFRNHCMFYSKTISLCNCNCNFRKIIPKTIFYVTVPNCNCKDIFPSDPQNCNCNGNEFLSDPKTVTVTT